MVDHQLRVLLAECADVERAIGLLFDDQGLGPTPDETLLREAARADLARLRARLGELEAQIGDFVPDPSHP